MKHQQGFTLIELAIVLVIVTILVGGLAMPLSAQIEARRISETRKTMEEAREAIMGFAMTHQTAGGKPYLPCPDADGDGIENRPLPADAECLQPRGYFPWVTLGVASQDAWGNRLWYEVTDPASDKTQGFSNTPLGNIQICNASGCTSGNVANNVPVVLVSAGPNGWGARNVNGNTLAAPTSTDELENNNALTNVNSIYISRSPSESGSALGEFDDSVVWISHTLLISRVCPTPGGCP